MDEPTHDSQIQQWFQGPGPSPVQPASPALQAKVHARILDQQRRSDSWTNRLSQPAWVTALIAALMLSLSANIWWGIGERMRAEPKLAGTVRSLTVYPFQRQLSPTEALRVAVAARTAAVPENIGRSFATTSDRRAAFLRLGTMYADALAALHSRDSSLASTYLQRLADILHGLQVPPVLSSYLQDIAAWMQRPSYTDVERIQLLALFEALYITAYTPLDAPHAVSLFQMGAWLENMVLAVTIRQPVMPQHPEVLQTYYDTLIHLQAPASALKAFRQLRTLMARAELNQEEFQQIRRLVQTLQRLLGAMYS